MLRAILTGLAGVLLVGGTAWTALALWYQLPWRTMLRALAVGVWCAIAVLLVVAARHEPWLGAVACGVAFGGVCVWWNGIKPSNERLWADDVARMAVGAVEGERVTVHNVRNFHWKSETEYVESWESRVYDLSGLSSVDFFTSAWGVPGIAHVIVSFGFEDGRFLAFSVEIRKERGEEYSELGGFFKCFELCVIAADERDVVRVRANVRGETVRVFRLHVSREVMRALFLEYVRQATSLAVTPRFYHTLTANCTSVVFFMMRGILGGLPLDSRLVFTEHLPEYVADAGGLTPGWDIRELRRRGDISVRAARAGDEDFSRLIRVGVPGWHGGDDTAYTP